MQDWILTVNHDERGTVEETIKDPVALISKRLKLTPKAAKTKMVEATESQVTITLPETDTLYEGELCPPE